LFFEFLSTQAGGEFAYLFPSTANSLNKLNPLTPVLNTLAASVGVGYMNNNSSAEDKVSRLSLTPSLGYLGRARASRQTDIARGRG
jgi:hypothetical protein